MNAPIRRPLQRACVFTCICILLLAGAVAQQSMPEYNDPNQKSLPTSAAGSTATSASSASNSATSQTRKLAYDLSVSGTSQWTDTSIDLLPGDKVTITATGNVQNAAAQAAGPEGFARGWRDLIRALPVNGAGSGALIGRFGDAAAAVPFLVGASKEFTVNRNERLFLGINQLAGEQSDGNFQVSVKITPAEKSTAAVTQEFAVSSDLLALIPRRVSDQSGNAGDVVNFVLIGSQEQLKNAFRDAGWVLVDRSKREAALHALLSSTEKQSYVEMPMSELYLFGRPQDFGYARAEPVQVVASRHHLRVWKAPFDYQGQTVWVGAATHDIGFEKDQRTGGVTHKIDANIDQERDFVGACFQEASTLAGSTYLLPSDAVREAHTATGGSFHSDGRVLVMRLGP
jgi:hypothetical protein